MRNEIIESSLVNGMQEIIESTVVNEMKEISKSSIVKQMITSEEIVISTDNNMRNEITKSSIVNQMQERGKSTTINNIEEIGKSSIIKQTFASEEIVVSTGNNMRNEIIESSIVNQIPESSVINELEEFSKSSIINGIDATSKSILIKENIITEEINVNNESNLKTELGGKSSNIESTINENSVNYKNDEISLSSENKINSINNNYEFDNFETTHNIQSQKNDHSSELISEVSFIITGNNQEIYQSVVDNVLQKIDLSKGGEMVFKGENNSFFHITNSKNELELLKGNSNNTNKFSIVDLGQCENKLKEHYHINPNVSLLIIKFEKKSNISSERFLQYEVYEPYTKTKLNLSVCHNITIEVYVPVVLSEKTQNLDKDLKERGYDLLDINSPFYLIIMKKQVVNQIVKQLII